MTTQVFGKPPTLVPPPNPSFGNYEPTRQLGVGLDGSAVLARDPSSGLHVELRLLTRVVRGAERFREIEEVLRRHAVIDHPLCLEVHDADLAAQPPTIVLEWAGSARLSDRLSGGALGPRAAVRIAERLAHGLGALHRVGLHHGMLAPSVVVLEDDATPRLDCTGLRVLPPSTSRLDAACRAPELEREASDASSDVYALGALLLTMLFGRAPTEEETGPARRASVAAPLDALITAMLAPDRDARPSAAEACIELRQILAGELAFETQSEAQPAHTTVTATYSALPEGAVTEGMTLGRFQLVKRLGAGGMGEVYQGVDVSTGELVAVKVLRPELSKDGPMMGRFRKEARMLAEVRNAYVANLLEVNADRGVHYLVMEYVGGPSLASVQAEQGTFAEREALAILADMCRALAEPHRRGIIHRDIKPDNVMFATQDAVATAPGVGRPRVKLCDFGIARRVNREDTLQLTRAGTVLGTPTYMAPEQCAGGDLVGPATDVYALTVTLFELLTGRPPFDADEPMHIMVKHLNEPPPSLATLAPQVSDATASLVARGLAKSPAERPADAGELLDAIEGILRGEPADITVHPQLPPARPDATVSYSFEWDLASSPEALWPYVCNTDRLYRASGRAPNKFERRGMVDGGVELLGSTSVGGVAQKWREYPYEWVEGRRWGALTVFEKGAARWMAFELALEKRPEGGTRLRYTVKAEPRNWFFKLMVKAEIGLRQRRALGKVFKRIDAVVSGTGRRSPEVDPFEPPAALSSGAEQRLDKALAALRSEGVPADVLEALGAFVRAAPDQSIARIRPLAFARSYGLGEEATVAAFLRGSRHGLFTLLWDVLCPLCRIPSGIADSLSKLEDHAHCPACNVDFKLDFARSIEMIFRVAPELRGSELRTYCVGGPAHSPHVAAQVRLAPGERFVLALALEPGYHQLRSPQLPDAVELRVSPDAVGRRLDLAMGGAPAGDGPVPLRAGDQTIVLTNALDRELVVRAERMAPRDDALTAARAASFALFRELFPDEVLAPGQLVSVASMALVVTSLAGGSALAARLGDERACDVVLQHFRLLDKAVSDEGGALIKTVGYGAVAAFDRVVPAVRAALAMQRKIHADARTRELGLRVAVHHGPMVAATIGDRLDYFGAQVDLAMGLSTYAKRAHVLLSRTVAEEPEVSALVDARALPFETAMVPALGPAFWVQQLAALEGKGDASEADEREDEVDAAE